MALGITLLLVSMILLYSLAMIITSNADMKADFDINVGGAIGICSALFFCRATGVYSVAPDIRGLGYRHYGLLLSDQLFFHPGSISIYLSIV